MTRIEKGYLRFYTDPSGDTLKVEQVVIYTPDTLHDPLLPGSVSLKALSRQIPSSVRARGCSLPILNSKMVREFLDQGFEFFSTRENPSEPLYFDRLSQKFFEPNKPRLPYLSMDGTIWLKRKAGHFELYSW